MLELVADVAALLGNPTRATMLDALMDGRAAPRASSLAVRGLPRARRPSI
jgi:hypothetical protein